MRYLPLFIVLLFTACSFKPPITKTHSILLTLKTPKIKYSDTAFVNHGESFTEVQLYNLAQEVGSLRIEGNKICFESLCYSKKEFNTLYLHESYGENFLEELFAKEGNTIFKDEIHDIKITIKELE